MCCGRSTSLTSEKGMMRHVDTMRVMLICERPTQMERKETGRFSFVTTIAVMARSSSGKRLLMRSSASYTSGSSSAMPKRAARRRT